MAMLNDQMVIGNCRKPCSKPFQMCSLRVAMAAWPVSVVNPHLAIRNLVIHWHSWEKNYPL